MQNTGLGAGVLGGAQNSRARVEGTQPVGELRVLAVPQALGELEHSIDRINEAWLKPGTSAKSSHSAGITGDRKPETTE
jgi:hypothetical protein